MRGRNVFFFMFLKDVNISYHIYKLVNLAALTASDGAGGRWLLWTLAAPGALMALAGAGGHWLLLLLDNAWSSPGQGADVRGSGAEFSFFLKLHPDFGTRSLSYPPSTQTGL